MSALLSDAFALPDGLITNEWAFWNKSDPAAKSSPTWEMDSGSFFASGGKGWTGIPDDKAPNADSSNGTNSAIFRLNTKRADFENVAVSMDVINQGFSSSPSTPPVDWDGVHIWLRYQTEYSLYMAYFNRRDGKCIIKKKVPGGPSNQGTYYELTPYNPHPVPFNTVQKVRATAFTNKDGSVTLSLYDGTTLLAQATDDGKIGGPPIKGPGKVGIRGDNANLKFDNFLVETFDPTVSTGPTIPLTGLVVIPAGSDITISWKPKTA